MRNAAKKPQFDRLPLLHRQCGQRRSYALRIHARKRDVLERFLFGKRFGQFGFGPRSAAAQDVERAVSRHAHEPCGEISAAEEIGCIPYFQENGLREVFGRRTIGEHSKRDAVHQTVMCVVECLECPRVTTFDPTHERTGVLDHLDRVRFDAAASFLNDVGAVIDSFFVPKAKSDAMDELVVRLRAARSVLALTGSGISAESGLPTFRGVGGLWRTHRVEKLASPDGFARDPVLVWTWYNERNAAHRRAHPNAGHYALARLETLVPQFMLATQNVDSLHVRAGSRNLLELHGNLREARCNHCGARRTLDTTGMPMELIEHPCGGRMRPDIVWFGEPLPDHVWQRASETASQADVILVVGTSAVVYPAAALAANARGTAYVAEINPEATAITDRVDCVLRGTAAEVLPAIVTALEEAF